jgi:hypothetical protein
MFMFHLIVILPENGVAGVEHFAFVWLLVNWGVPASTLTFKLVYA